MPSPRRAAPQLEAPGEGCHCSSRGRMTCPNGSTSKPTGRRGHGSWRPFARSPASLFNWLTEYRYPADDRPDPPGRRDLRRRRRHRLRPHGRAAALALGPRLRRRLGARSSPSSAGSPPATISHGDDLRMALPVGRLRGADRRALVPDGARRGRLALPLRAAARPRLDRRGDRRRQPVLHRHLLPARLADRRPVRPDRHRSAQGPAPGRMVRLDARRLRLRRGGRPAARARRAG